MARHTVPAEAGRRATRALDVILGDDIEDQFDVVPEDVPPDLPTAFEDRTINWVNNFTVQKKPNVPEKSGSKVKYTIELDRISGQWVYYDPEAAAVTPLSTRGVGRNRVQADLFADDPSIGHT